MLILTRCKRLREASLDLRLGGCVCSAFGTRSDFNNGGVHLDGRLMN